MPGRKPIPTALRVLRGNPGKRSLNTSEPKPTGIPECPKELPKLAKQEWDRVSAELIALGLLTSVDRAALAAYCSAYARWIDAEKHLKKDGAVIETKSGNFVQSPWVGVANRSLELMYRFLTEFGLTPASRTRLRVEPATHGEEDQFWQEMMGGNPAAKIAQA